MNMIEKLGKTIGTWALAVMMVAWLAGCNQSSEVASHDHDHDGEHEHTHDHDGDGHDHGEEGDGDGNVMATLADAEVAAQKAAYPLKECLVGGEELGSMGDPVEYVHEGRLVQFCCESCIDEFKKDTTQYLAKLDTALAAAGASEEK